MGARWVLIVEDDDAIRELLVEVLEQEGYRTTAEPNGERALSTLRASAAIPDVLLVDVMMPVMDGLALLRELRRDLRFATMRAIVATAAARVEDAQALGLVAVLQKPIDLNQLLRLLADATRAS